VRSEQPKNLVVSKGRGLRTDNMDLKSLTKPREALNKGGGIGHGQKRKNTKNDG